MIIARFVQAFLVSNNVRVPRIGIAWDVGVENVLRKDLSSGSVGVLGSPVELPITGRKPTPRCWHLDNLVGVSKSRKLLFDLTDSMVKPRISGRVDVCVPTRVELGNYIPRSLCQLSCWVKMGSALNDGVVIPAIRRRP